MQEEIIHPAIIITSYREVGTWEDLHPYGLVKGANLHFIGATTGIEPPIGYLFKRRSKISLPPCPGCVYEKNKAK